MWIYLTKTRNQTNSQHLPHLQPSLGFTGIGISAAKPRDLYYYFQPSLLLIQLTIALVLGYQLGNTGLTLKSQDEGDKGLDFL